MKTILRILIVVWGILPSLLQAQGLQMTGNSQMNMQPNTRLNMQTGSQTLNVGGSATLRGEGTITGDVINNGTLSAGNPTGTLTINGTLNNQGLVEVQLQGISAGQYDLVTVNGAGTVAGTVQVIYLSGYTLPAATTLDVITTTGLTYSATEISPPTAPVLDNANNVYLGLGVYLSVGYLTLEAERTENDNIQVRWTTSQEQNNKGFEVQKSLNGIDFEAVGFVEGKGNSNTLSRYAYTFQQAEDVYIRIKQIDFEGKYAYSSVVFVKRIGQLRVYPNPSNGTFAVEVGKVLERVPIKILNPQGAVIWQDTLPTNPTGKHILQTNLPTGAYFLHLTLDGKPLKHKIIIQH